MPTVLKALGGSNIQHPKRCQLVAFPNPIKSPNWQIELRTWRLVDKPHLPQDTSLFKAETASLHNIK
jgi:hypothetical protein